MSSFDVVLSVRCLDDEHINLKEARALLVFVRWVLRKPAHFGRRLVVLVDSNVVVGAVTKGRSASYPLNLLLRRLAALCLFGDLLLHVVFIATEHNPADAPSRGVKRKRRIDELQRERAQLDATAQRRGVRLAEERAQLEERTIVDPFLAAPPFRGKYGYRGSDESGLSSGSNDPCTPDRVTRISSFIF
jgi:hypothetical protein